MRGLNPGKMKDDAQEKNGEREICMMFYVCCLSGARMPAVCCARLLGVSTRVLAQARKGDTVVDLRAGALKPARKALQPVCVMLRLVEPLKLFPF